MVVKFNKLKLYNFCSYESASISLADKGFCLVSGRNNFKKDNALSNGSGKSTIWSAICFALTGETISGIKSNLKNINATDSTCYVCLDFCVDEDQYSITRHVSPKPDLKILKNSVDISGKGIRESEKILAENLPDLTKDLIASTIILGQGMPNKFSSFSPSGRKDLLEKLTKSDFMIDDIKARISTRLEELNKQLRACDDSLLVNSTQFNLISTSLQQLEVEYDSYSKIKYEELLDASKKALHDLQTDFNNKDAESKKLSTEIDAISEQLLKVVSDKSDATNEEFKSYTEAYNAVTSDKKLKDALITSTRAEITKLKSIKDVCPTCGQKIPGVLVPDTAEQEKNLSTLLSETEQLENRIKEIKTKHESYVAQIEQVFANANVLQQKQHEYKNTLCTLQAVISSLSTKISNETATHNRLLYEKENHDRVVNTTAKKIEESRSQVANLSSIIDSTKLAKTEIESHIAVVKKIESLVKRDFRGYLLYNIIEYLNTKMKEYSKIVFDTDELSIYLDGNSLDISYCNKLYESLSGGEKQRVDIITQFAIRDLLQVYFNYSSNILVLDEITDNLDKIATGRIFDLIADQLKDVESIFIVSHHDDELAIPVDTELQVIKDENNISSVKEIT